MKRDLAKKLLDKTAEDYNLIAEDFSKTRFFLWPEFSEFLKFIKNGDSILDLGCGNGRLYELFEDLSIDYLGLDRSSNLISAAKEKWKGCAAKFGIGDALDLEFKNEFDAVFFIAVLHHISSEELRLEALKGIYDSLKPGGKFFMTNWMLWQKKYLPHILKYTALKIIGKNKMDFGDILLPWKMGKEWTGRYYHAFTERKILRLAKRAGFKIIKSWKSDRNYVMICEK